jgi:hypothetical protein
MREYKFRGIKKPSGQLGIVWVYGNLFKDNKGNYSIVTCNGHGSLTYHPVAAETVGQYTGLSDKNGKPIFEGDIWHDKNSGPGWMSMPMIIGYNSEYGQYKGALLKRPKEFIYNVFPGPHGEVIGNVHQDSHLLTGEKGLEGNDANRD